MLRQSPHLLSLSIVLYRRRPDSISYHGTNGNKAAVVEIYHEGELWANSECTCRRTENEEIDVYLFPWILRQNARHVS